LSGELDRARGALAQGVARLLERDEQRSARARSSLEGAMARAIERERDRLERVHERLRGAPALAVERKRAVLESTAGRLRALSPLATLERGYAVVRTDNGSLIRSTAAVESGDRLNVRVADGSFGARVE
jgi:exodeoxyribonuclease VII large subunit